jgi:Family of unknown function (DUF6510)
MTEADMTQAELAGEYEDGNALAGPLREIFAVDVTAAVGQCVSCGLIGPIAILRVYPLGSWAERDLVGSQRHRQLADPTAGRRVATRRLRP